jgi:glycosyltransferase involved in cell wall biosynthesis
MAKITREAGFRNTIFVLPKCNAIADFFREENFEVFEYPEIEPSFRHNRKYYADSKILARKFSEIKPDLLHCADYGGAFRVSLSALLSMCTLVSHVRSRHDCVTRRDRVFLASVKHWIFVSRDARENFSVQVKDERATIIYDGIKIIESDEAVRKQNRESVFNEFNLKPNEKIIGVLARVAPEKDFFTLARAVKRIIEKENSVKVIIVGSISREKANERHFSEVSQFLSDLGIAEHFVFTDFRSDVTRFLDSFDIFVLPTHVEGFPLVILEAMAQKVPVIATAVGGVPEAIRHGKTGFLHEHENSNELAQAIETLLENTEFAEKIAEAGYQSVKENFSQQKFAENIVNFYRRVLNLK